MRAASLTTVTIAQRPELRAAADRLVASNLPEFMMWESPGNWRWHRVYELFPGYQKCLLAGDRVVATLHAVPIAWDGTPAGLPAGYDAVLVQATAPERPAPTATCLLSISVDPAFRRCGLPDKLIELTVRESTERGFLAVVAPVRPTLKSDYPHVDIADYAARTLPSGEPFDPWLRAHTRLGGTILGVARDSLVVTQPRRRWAKYLGRPLPDPGGAAGAPVTDVVVEGALAPVAVDEAGSATYREPNVWVCHSCPWQESRS